MKLKECKNCDLFQYRSQVVCGRGNRKAKIMLVGEAPGKDEDREGKPFIGKAGQNLNKWIKKAGLVRSELFISNSVKCKPPKRNGSYKPTDIEIERCKSGSQSVRASPELPPSVAEERTGKLLTSLEKEDSPITGLFFARCPNGSIFRQSKTLLLTSESDPFSKSPSSKDF